MPLWEQVKHQETGRKSVTVSSTPPCRSRRDYPCLAGLALIRFTALSADLVISNWAGYMAPDIAETFKAATGLTIEVVNHATNEEIMGKLMASQGKGYDVVFVSSPFAHILNGQGLPEPLGAAKVPNLNNLYPQATKLAFDPGNTYAIPYAWGTTGLCYRSDLVEAAPIAGPLCSIRRSRAEGQDHHALDRPLADGRRPALQGVFGQREGSGQDRGGKNALIEAKKALLAYDDTTFFSKLVSGEACWCRPGTAGATTALPRTTRSSSSCRRKAPTSGSTRWS